MKNILVVLFFGSIWGLLEATLGGTLHFFRLPFTGVVMNSIGMALMFAAMRGGIKPSGLFAMSMVAASFKFFDVFLFALPILDRHIVNPATAIALEGLAFAVVVKLTPSWRSFPALAARFCIAACLGMTAFNAVSVLVYGWQTSNTSAPIFTALVHLPLIALFTTLLVKGYEIATAHSRTLPSVRWQLAGTFACINLAIAVRAIF